MDAAGRERPRFGSPPNPWRRHKAILAALGLRYEDRHFKQLGHGTGEISKLLPEALHDPINPDVAEKVAKLERRANISRYPTPQLTRAGSVLVAPAASFTDSEQDIDDAQELLSWCRERVVRALRATGAMRPSP